MIYYSQLDPRWANLKYDVVNTFKSYGCFVVALSMMLDKLPTETAKILKDNGLFTNGYINNIAKAAEVLGLEYNGKSQTKPSYDTIAWTNYYDNASTNTIEKHFFIVRVYNSLLDPLGKGIYYPIKEYYLFRGGNMSWYSIG